MAYFSLYVYVISGVQKIIIPSMHVEGSKHAQRMCKFFKGYLYFAAGKENYVVIATSD